MAFGSVLTQWIMFLPIGLLAFLEFLVRVPLKAAYDKQKQKKTTTSSKLNEIKPKDVTSNSIDTV